MSVETITTAIVAGFILSIDPENKFGKKGIVILENGDDVNKHLSPFIAAEDTDILETVTVTTRYQFSDGTIEVGGGYDPFLQSRHGDPAVKIRCEAGHESLVKVMRGRDPRCFLCATATAIIDDSLAASRYLAPSESVPVN